MGTFSKFIEKKMVDGVFTEFRYDIFHNGACQCIDDCDCYTLKGKFLYTSFLYKHPLSYRSFQSLDGCKQSYNRLSIETKTNAI